MEEHKKRLAILLTCHNRVKKTVECLRSVENQQFISIAYDIILVDAGSTDNTPYFIKRYFPDVIVIKADSSLYWNTGMRCAFAHAIEKNYGFYLWLNDDTLLFPNALSTLFATYTTMLNQKKHNTIIVGSTCDPDTGLFSYGGWIAKVGPLRGRSWGKIKPDDHSITFADTMNGNCVLIPAKVVSCVGNLDAHFTHGMGDLDYGLRARSKHCTIALASAYVGHCKQNDGVGLWTDSQHPVLYRWKQLLGSKGLPISEWFLFCFRHKGKLWFISWLAPYILFWVKVFKELLQK